MGAITRTWWPLFLAIGIIQTGNGIAGLLISLKTETLGLSPGISGAVIGMFYFGSAIGALAPPRPLKRLGHFVSFAGFVAIAGLGILGFLLSDRPEMLMLMRFLQGFGLSAMFAVSESWINRGVAEDIRARTFAVYIMVQLMGQLIGQLLLRIDGASAALLFALAGAALLSAPVILGAGRLREPVPVDQQVLPPWRVVWRAPQAAFAIALSGFLWAAVMGIGPIFAERSGLVRDDIALFMAMALLGGALTQFPLGALADHTSRALTLMGMGIGGACLAALGFSAGDAQAAVLISLAFGVGAMSFPIYAIAAPLGNERLTQEERTSASATMVLLFSLGATACPPVMSQAMAHFGPQAFFGSIGLCLAALAISMLGYRERSSEGSVSQPPPH